MGRVVTFFFYLNLEDEGMWKYWDLASFKHSSVTMQLKKWSLWMQPDNPKCGSFYAEKKICYNCDIPKSRYSKKNECPPSSLYLSEEGITVGRWPSEHLTVSLIMSVACICMDRPVFVCYCFWQCTDLSAIDMTFHVQMLTVHVQHAIPYSSPQTPQSTQWRPREHLSFYWLRLMT